LERRAKGQGSVSDLFLNPDWPGDVLTFPTFGPINKDVSKGAGAFKSISTISGHPSDLRRTTAKLLGLERTFTELYLIH
jgi:hypothetical protein